MKLALVIPGFQADAQDWCIPAFTNLAHELSRRLELHVFALRYPARRDIYSVGDVRVHAVGAGAFGGFRAPFLSLVALWRAAMSDIESEHAVGPFDAVLGVWATESGWLATQAAKRLGVPCLVHLAGGELARLSAVRYGNQRERLARVLVGSTLRKANLITAPSGPMEQAARGRLGMHSTKVVRWSLGVDTATFAPQPGSPEVSHALPTFVSVGSLIPVKGYEWLMEGFTRLRASRPEINFRWQVAGGGPLLPHLRELVTSAGLEGYVSFLGDVPHDRLPQLLRSADCIVFGSFHEAQCMAVLEGMACGLPWIGPPVGALADCDAMPLKSGIAIKGRSIDELASALCAMLTAPVGERRAWGLAARQTVVDRYELRRQSDLLVEQIAKLTTLPTRG